MAFCPKCGAQVAEGAVCACSQAPQQAPPPYAQQPQPQYAQQPPPPQYAQQPPPPPPQYGQQPPPPYGQQPYGPPQPPADNSKTFSMLAYIPPLWLIGLLSSTEKQNPRVRFNVGQGIILSIAYAAVSIVLGILGAIIISPRDYYNMVWGGGCSAGMIISNILWLLCYAGLIFLTVVGIMNVSKGQDKPLPVIGKLAFYK